MFYNIEQFFYWCVFGLKLFKISDIIQVSKAKQMFDYCKKKYFKKHIDKGEKKNIMEPQSNKSHRKGSSSITASTIRNFVSWCREPDFGYKTFQRLRLFFVAVAEVFFLLLKKKESDLV